jgi:ribosome biogenesis protein NSA2
MYRQQGQGLHSSVNVSGLARRKNPNGQSYTSLGVITKGTVIEVNVSELGLVTPGGKVVWGKYAQVTNNPENDGCINAVLLV